MLTHRPHLHRRRLQRRQRNAFAQRMKKLPEDTESFYHPKRSRSGHEISGRFASDNGGRRMSKCEVRTPSFSQLDTRNSTFPTPGRVRFPLRGRTARRRTRHALGPAVLGQFAGGGESAAAGAGAHGEKCYAFRRESNEMNALDVFGGENEARLALAGGISDGVDSSSASALITA